MENLEFLVALLSSLSALVALIIKLYRTLSSLINERKYAELFDIVSNSIIEAEALCCLSGEEKKARVMEVAQSAADSLGIEGFDAERISSVIETIIEVSKKVNVK